MIVIEGTVSVDEHLREHDGDTEGYVRDLARRAVAAGFIRWNVGEAYEWSGSWGGDRVLYTVLDARGNHPPLMMMQEILEKGDRMVARSRHRMPKRLTTGMDFPMMIRDTPCNRSELLDEEFRLVLDGMTSAERDVYDSEVARQQASLREEQRAYPCVERPFLVHLQGVHLQGDDDTSYGLAYATLDEALADIRRLADEPRMDVLWELGYVFTN